MGNGIRCLRISDTVHAVYTCARVMCVRASVAAQRLPLNCGRGRHAIYHHTVHTKHSGLRRSCWMCITAVHVVQHCCDGCCEGDCSYCTGDCRLCSTARMCRSIEVRQEVVGLCGRGFRLRCGRCPTLLCSTEGGADVGSPTCLHRHAVHGTGPRACRRGRTGSCPPPCVASPARGMWCTEKPQ